MALGCGAIRMVATITASLAFLGASGASAQNQGSTPQPQAEVVATHGDWEERCIDLQGGERRCALVQMGTAETQDVGARALVTLTKGGEGGKETVARFEVPIGVYLPNGLGLKIDGKKYGGVPFQFCQPDRCTAIAVLSDEQAGALRAGQSASLEFFADRQRSIEVPISLMGVTAGLAALN